MRPLPAFAALLAVAVLASAALAPAPPDVMVGGIQVHEPDHGRWMRALERAGLDTVAVTVYAHQGDWDSAHLWWAAEEPWVVAEMRAARERGLRVVLVLRVALDHGFERNRFLWHGMIQPRTDPELERWFERYRGFAARWAAIAEREGVEVLAVASELSSMTSTVPVAALPELEEYWSNEEKVARHDGRLLEHAPRLEAPRFYVAGGPDYTSLASYLEDRAAAHRDWARRVGHLDAADPLAAINARRRRLDEGWRGVVAAVRKRYRGRVTYAANFDQYRSVGFWDALDLIGVNAYFPLQRWLTDARGADLDAHLRARWRTILSRLDAFRRRRGLDEKRVLFTEIGYVERAHATLAPWAADGVSIVERRTGEDELMDWSRRPRDRQERARALAALDAAHRDLGGALLAGVLYWKLSTDPAHRDIEPFAVVLEPDEPAVAALRRLAGPAGLAAG